MSRPGAFPRNIPEPREADAQGAFTEVVDRRSGAITARGHLTVQGADLLRGAVLALQDGGHDRVEIDLTGVPAADAAGLDVLRSLQESLAAGGGALVLLHAPRSA